MAGSAPRAFVSYCREDSEFALHLSEDLKAADANVWIDKLDIEPGSQWDRAIQEAAANCPLMLVLLSPASVNSDNVLDEINFAFDKRKTIIPVFYRDCEMPFRLRRVQYIDFRTDYQHGLKSLLKSLGVERSLAANAQVSAASTRNVNAHTSDEHKPDAENADQEGKSKQATELVRIENRRKHTGKQVGDSWLSRARQTLLSRTQTRKKIVLVASAILVLGFAVRWASRPKQGNSETQTKDRTTVSGPVQSDHQSASGSAAADKVSEAKRPMLEVPSQELPSTQPRLVLSVDAGVEGVTWSPDGQRLATANSDWTAKVWDTATGQEVLTLSGHNNLVSSVAWSLDGKRLATASWDGTAKVWDAANGQAVLTLRGPTNTVTGVAWSPDGRQLATASSDQTAKVWDATSGQQGLTLSGHSGAVNSVAWSPDGKQLATASSDRTAKVWDAASGQQVLTLSGHTGAVKSVAWSPDGKRLATASSDRTAKVWDTATGQEVLTLSGHNDLVSSVAWSLDGKRLATASWDGTAKVWDAANGQAVLTLRGPTNTVTGVAWSPDGRQLATAALDGTTKLW